MKEEEFKFKFDWRRAIASCISLFGMFGTGGNVFAGEAEEGEESSLGPYTTEMANAEINAFSTGTELQAALDAGEITQKQYNDAAIELKEGDVPVLTDDGGMIIFNDVPDDIPDEKLDDIAKTVCLRSNTPDGTEVSFRLAVAFHEMNENIDKVLDRLSEQLKERISARKGGVSTTESKISMYERALEVFEKVDLSRGNTRGFALYSNGVAGINLPGFKFMDNIGKLTPEQREAIRNAVRNDDYKEIMHTADNAFKGGAPMVDIMEQLPSNFREMLIGVARDVEEDVSELISNLHEKVHRDERYSRMQR